MRYKFLYLLSHNILAIAYLFGFVSLVTKDEVPSLAGITSISTNNKVHNELTANPSDIYDDDFHDILNQELPTFRTNNIPSPKYYQDVCESLSKTSYCIDPTTDRVVSIAMVIYSEGGGLHPQAAVDLLQTMVNGSKLSWENNLYNIGNSDKDPFSSLTGPEKLDVMRYFISLPYRLQATEWPNWNGWAIPIDIDKMFCWITDAAMSPLDCGFKFGANLFDSILDLVENWAYFGEIRLSFLGNTYFPNQIISNNPNIKYVFCGINERIPYLDDNSSYKHEIVLLDSFYILYYSYFPYP